MLADLPTHVTVQQRDLDLSAGFAGLAALLVATGLGLSIVQRIVSAIGGRIEVASGPKGSDFSLVFPEAEP